PVPPRDPFRLLCLGRLSSYKFLGQLTVVKNARRLMRDIPSLEITVVGGGWRRMLFVREAAVANARAGRRVIRTVGYQTDPAPWIRASTAVCGGSTCGIEAILSNRPIVAMSGNWFGLITPDNLEEAVDCYYGERGGKFYLPENPEVVLEELVDLYKNWDQDRIASATRELRERMLPDFSPESAARDWEALLEEVL
ncbi:hypothetical protein LJC31_08815, partial [Synergistaceae bacterium OttesenSCG-928-I11]|nr:hypothetical protein [Synergistaceae bacterium OttesenSCG-928-I11]